MSDNDFLVGMLLLLILIAPNLIDSIREWTKE